MYHFACGGHSLSDDSCQIVHRIRYIGSDIEDLIARGRNVYCPCDRGGDIVDMRESADLSSVTKNCHGFGSQDPVHEDPNYVAIAITNVLPLAIHVVRPENNVVQPEHLMTDFEFLLDG